MGLAAGSRIDMEQSSRKIWLYGNSQIATRQWYPNSYNSAFRRGSVWWRGVTSD